MTTLYCKMLGLLALLAIFKITNSHPTEYENKEEIQIPSPAEYIEFENLYATYLNETDETSIHGTPEGTNTLGTGSLEVDSKRNGTEFVIKNKKGMNPILNFVVRLLKGKFGQVAAKCIIDAAKNCIGHWKSPQTLLDCSNKYVQKNAVKCITS